MKLLFDASKYPREISLMEDKWITKTTQLSPDENIGIKLKDTLANIAQRDNSFTAMKEMNFINKVIDTFDVKTVTIEIKD